MTGITLYLNFRVTGYRGHTLAILSASPVPIRYEHQGISPRGTCPYEILIITSVPGS